MILFRKYFTQWDETDQLKGMKDSDILAEKKRSTSSLGPMVGSGLVGASIGGITGAVSGAISGRGARIATAGKVAKKGAILGAGIGAATAYLRNKKKADENRFYNQRLEYAQRQALRRERKDWKTNMTQRDGYSY